MKRFSSQWPIIILIITTLVIYLPILINPHILLNRNNDLQEFFFPLFDFSKRQILDTHTLPLWNNMFFSGSPLLSDPQSPIFYPPNLIFLFLPLNVAFIFSLLIHSLFMVITMYWLTRYGLKMSNLASTVSALIYLTSPRLAGYLEAGHFGLAATLAWLPLAILTVIKLSRNPKLIWSIIFSFSLAGIFYTHTVTFILASISAFLFFIICLFYQKNPKHLQKKITFFTIGAILTLGLTAIALFPQLEWTPTTTRFLLLQDEDVYPKWASFKESLTVTFAPWLGYKNNIWGFDSEKWLTVGLLPTILGLIGFWSLKNKVKFSIIALILVVLFISLNNLSPFHNFLLSQDWYVLMRVSTRIWFILQILVAILVGIGVEKMIKSKGKNIFPFLIILMTLAELIFINWTRINKPISPPEIVVPEEVYNFLANDLGYFRVFCVTRCLSQKLVAQYKLETVEGYGTLQQKNYFNQFIQLSQQYWNHYTLALPPFEIYKFSEIQPYAPELADYNVKYVISPYKLTDKRLVLEKQFGNYSIYINSINKTRAYYSNDKEASILYYSPNKIIINTSLHQTDQVILAEVYNSGWQAKLNGKDYTPINETKNALRQITIKPDTQFVEFSYQPKSYFIGRIITLATLLIIILLFFKGRKNKNVF
ncbi:hypothetical protein HY404_00780 [Candidatus Microgenomates bacterium]|nr:hypothetical protein [Candidatus Microgenomates bacterium]